MPTATKREEWTIYVCPDCGSMASSSPSGFGCHYTGCRRPDHIPVVVVPKPNAVVDEQERSS